VRTLPSRTLSVLVFPVQVFGGLRKLDVPPSDHLTSALHRRRATALILSP